MKILATVDAVATNIIGKFAVTRSRFLKHFQSKAKLKRNANYYKRCFLSHNLLVLLVFYHILLAFCRSV